MGGNPSAEQLVNWIKKKNLQHLALFVLNAHTPVLGLCKHIGIASSFIIPLFGCNSFLAHIINCLSSDEALQAVRTKLASDNS